MKVQSVALYALGLCSMLVMIVGCNGGGSRLTDVPGQSGISPSLVEESFDLSPIAASRKEASRNRDGRGDAWMAPEAKSEDLLYISNVYTVTVYSYPKGKHVGTLKGFYSPLGECSDEAGDVFIANGDTILEYAHGGKRSIQTLTLSGYSAQSCGVDPTTGNLAVTWEKGSQGYVAVYPDATGNPTLYSNGGMLFNFCGYDSSGDLFADGINGSSQVVELPKGGSTLSGITLNQSIGWPGAVQWDGKYVAVGDEAAEAIYRFAISGSTGTLEGTLDLGDAQSVIEWWIDGKTVVGADDLPSTIWYWRYPAGGSPKKSITKDIFHPAGATISRAERP